MSTRHADCARVIDSAVGRPEILVIARPGNAGVTMCSGDDATCRTLQIPTQILDQALRVSGLLRFPSVKTAEPSATQAIQPGSQPRSGQLQAPYL
jgi:hypothetical protein